MHREQSTGTSAECSTVYEIGGDSEGKGEKAKLYRRPSEMAQIGRLLAMTYILHLQTALNSHRKE